MSKIKRKMNYCGIFIIILIEISSASSQPSSVLISTQQQSKEKNSQDFIQTHNKCEPITIPYVFHEAK